MQFHCIKMSLYFLKPYEPFGGDINVKVDFRLDIDKLVPVPVDLSKLIDVVKDNVVKKLCMIN